MRYQVPQFIEIEDKIFGPLTLKQFIYLAGGGGVSVLLYEIFPLFVAVFFIVPIVALAVALAFYKVNGQPFIKILEYAFYYVVGSKLYLWRKNKPLPKASEEVKAVSEGVLVPTLSRNKLKDLAWSLNIKEHKQLGVREDERRFKI